MTPDNIPLSPLELFRRKHGAEWYIFINSPLFKAAELALIQSGPVIRLVGLPPQEVAALGTIYAANIQGWQDFLQTLKTQMILTPEGSVPDVPDYAGEEEQ